MALTSNRNEINQRIKKMGMEGRDIPESVAMEILSKLPVKTVARIRCVSKRWASYFQTSYFITKHYRNNVDNNNNNPFNLILFEESRFFPIVYGPCNGLLCTYDIATDSPALWNPSTREFKLIPTSTVPLPRPPSRRNASYTRCSMLGFGYISATDDYKVVRINTFDGLYQVELYSFKSNSWKEISAPEPEPEPRPYPIGLPLFSNYVNGFCYWQGMIPDDLIILAFDMANEKFSTLPWPICLDQYVGCKMELLGFNGLLGALFFSPGRYLDLWVMMNGRWTRQFSINSFPGLWMPMGFSKIGDIYFRSSNEELALFDPVTKEVKNLGVTVLLKGMQLIAYDESLVRVNGRSDEEHLIRWSAGEIQIVRKIAKIRQR